MVAAFVKRVGLPATRRQRAEKTALQLERQYGVTDNMLINACQLDARDLAPPERRFADRTVGESRSILGNIPAAALWDTRRLRHWSGLTAVLLAAWLVYALALPRHCSNALARYVLPLGDIPPAGSLALRIVPDDDVTLSEGEDLAVRAELGLSADAATVRHEAPTLVWSEGTTPVRPSPSAGEHAVMTPIQGAPQGYAYAYTFRGVRQPFTFRVFGGNTYSRSIRVKVTPLPAIASSIFRVLPPAYTGQPAAEQPGPPSTLKALEGSSVHIRLTLTRPVAAAAWTAGGSTVDFTRDRNAWTVDTKAHAAAPYRVVAKDPSLRQPLTLAEGEVGLEKDRPPRIDFLTDNRNRYVSPGAQLELELEAQDDFGVRNIRVTARRTDRPAPAGGQDTAPTDPTPGAQDTAPPATGFAIKAWTYAGPPGHPGPLTERLLLDVNPTVFEPGVTYLIQAFCRDFQPGGNAWGASRPFLLRVKDWNALAVPEGDSLEKAFALLKKTIHEQKQANALTANLTAHLDIALSGNTLPQHRKAMHDKQSRAQATGRSACKAFRAHDAGTGTAAGLEPLVLHEMVWVLTSIGRLDKDKGSTVADTLRSTEARQEFILARLIALLGSLSESRQASRQPGTETEDARPPPVTAEDAGRRLRDDLDKFTRAQKRLVKASLTLADKKPEDLTEEEESILGDLAREEAEWARFFEERLTDFSKLPLQDFADGAVAQEFNEIVQEVKLAAKELYEKNVELAVPHEQSGLESAEELVHNLERWLPDTPDHTKWLMEDPLVPPDVPLAELPAELEDIIGDLLDEEDQMGEDVEDVTSAWMDSIDKGAGWDTMDGPISSMSAKGVTGNRLPNEHEVGGRSGEGRTGRSHGQMVEETAQGKGGRETPTRLTPSPFEPGTVEDSSQESTGGATGGGKLSGFTGEGLRGPAPMPRLEKMARLAGRQARIRQSAEAVALKLRAYHLPSGDLDGAVGAMKRFESAAVRGDGLAVRQAYHHIVDALEEARRVVRAEFGLHRERSRLPDWTRQQIMTGLREGTPRGYEEMIAAYFRALAEGGQKEQP